MDSNSLIPLGVLVLAAVLLVLIAAAEAGITAISRSRIRSTQSNGLAGLLRSYIRQRHYILRSLSVGTSAVIVSGTAAFMYAVLRDEPLTPVNVAVTAAIALFAVALLRQTTRAIVQLDPETWGLRLSKPIAVLHYAFLPFAWLVNAPIEAMLRLVGRRSALDDIDPTEELVGMLEVSDDDADAVLVEERRMMRGVLEMSGQTVRELMTPRTDVIAVSMDASMGDVVKVITESGVSRVPLYEETLDRIIGVIYAKDVLAYLRTGDVTPMLTDIARPPYYVPETKRANELLADLRRDQVHMAVAVDEYGGTAGVITVEDLVEEIVGEIADEYDTADVDVQQISDTQLVVDARLTIDELNELVGAEIHSEDFDTVGGLIFTLLGRLAVPGDEVVTPFGIEDDDDRRELSLRVLSILGRRIKKVRVTQLEPAEREDEVSAEVV